MLVDARVGSEEERERPYENDEEKDHDCHAPIVGTKSD
jgi:hypothetical protein